VSRAENFRKPNPARARGEKPRVFKLVGPRVDLKIAELPRMAA